MRLDHVIMRMTAVKGPSWLQAYALVDLEPEVDVAKFRFELPKRLTFHHETEMYLGGVPGDLFIGFFARGQKELFDEIGRIKAMPEVQEVRDFAIGNFPIGEPALSRLDWQILRCLRKDADKPAALIAEELTSDPARIHARLAHIKSIPAAFSIERPNDRKWTFTEIQFNFRGTTFEERVAALAKFGKPFGAVNGRTHGAVMVDPATVAELRETIAGIGRIPGVEVKGVTFCEDMLWTQPWLDRFIEEQIASAAD